MPWHEIAIRLGLALLAGAITGGDREIRGKPAGLKTHALVALGAATFTLISLEFMARSAATLDPLRLVAGIVGGIGFLGAGTIIQSRGDVQGVTTAAGIWIVGAMGVACGAGFYIIAGIALAGTLLILIPVRLVERRLMRRYRGEHPGPVDDHAGGSGH